jgi:lipoprotein-anchoring transpeptidase ErfK/SrfK
VVEVSDAFTSGIPAKSADRSRAERAELNARLGQLTYTLTQFEDVRSAKVVAGGVAVEPALERDDYAKPAKGPPDVTRAKGQRSPSTRAVQERLAKLRYLPRKAVDGVDGYRTQQAVIAFQSWRGLERDGIVGPATSAALARASRPKPRADGPAHRIEVYRDKGVALLIENGKTKRAIHISAGQPSTPTPAGTYEVFRKELRSWSVPFSVWLPYASYFNQGIAFHEYPDVPVYPASHGCVRVPAPEAKGVYAFASIGTTVVVY